MSVATLLLSAAIAAVSPPNGSAQSPEQAPVFAAAPIALAELDHATAREDLSQVAVSQQTSTVSSNSVTGSVTGAVTIAGNAFQNLQGLAVISANSGNNVSINSSMTVNLQFNPAP